MAMNKRFIIPLLAAAAITPMTAQINSTATDGWLARGVEMFDDHNYNGCIDQLTHIDRSALTTESREQVDWLLARAQFAINGSGTRPHFVAFLSLYPYSLHRYEAIMYIGDCLFESSYADALKAYQRVDRNCLTLDKAEDLDYHMAYCYLRLADFDRALPLFNRLSRTDAYGHAARFYQAYIAYARGDYGEAERLFKSVDTAKAPGNMADYYLAQIYYMRGDYREALATSRSLLRRSGIEAGFTAEANRLAGESLYQLGDAAAAIPYLKKYVAAVETPEASTLYILGISQYNQGDYEGAVASLQSVSELNDAMGQSASLYIGQALMKLGEKDAALLAFDKALRMDFDPAVREAAYYNYAVAKFSGANIPFGSSVATFEAFLNRYPDSRYAPEVQEYIVDGYLTDKNYDQALASINRMSRPSKKVLAAKQKVLYNLGASALASGNPTTALVYLNEADGLRSHDADVATEVNLLIGEAAYRTGDYAASQKALNTFLTRSKNNNVNRPLAYYDLGYTEFARKHYPQAADAFRKAVASPGNLSSAVIADAYNRLGDVSYYASDFTEAKNLYDKAYKTNPASGDYALFQTAIMKGFVRDHKGKIADLQRLPQEFPSSTLLADAMLEMTASYIQLGDNQSAISTYRRLVSEYPNTTQGRQGYLQLALTLLNDGDRADAIESYRDIVRLYPTSEEAREATEALKRLAAEDGTLSDYAEFVNSVPDAPKIDVAEVEQLSFEAAEKDYLTEGKTAKLHDYVTKYADGAYRARALSLLLEDARSRRDDKAAVEVATTLVEQYPDNSVTEPAYVVQATALYENGDTEAALAAWKALEQRASSSKNLNAARAGIMRAARDLGNYEEVAAAADALLTSSTIGSEDKNEAVFSKALALSQTGRADEAREQWQSIAGMTDDLYGAKSAFYLAQSYFDDGIADRARTTVEDLTASGTPHSYWLARGFILLSDIYASQGKDFEAREYLNALRENYPGSESDIFMMIDSRLSSLKQ